MPIDWFRVITDLNRAGFSLEQMAKEAGVTHPTIINWRDGRNAPMYEPAQRLLIVYHSVIKST